MKPNRKKWIESKKRISLQHNHRIMSGDKIKHSDGKTYLVTKADCSGITIKPNKKNIPIKWDDISLDPKIHPFLSIIEKMVKEGLM